MKPGKASLLHWALPLLMLVAAGCSPPDLRNAVVICLDTVRADVFEAIDSVADDDFSRWSARALHFDDALSNSPWTIPSVATVLTGLDPSRHDAGRFDRQTAHLGTMWPSRLSADVPTLQEILVTRGWRSAAFVSHWWLRPGVGLTRGFDRMETHGSDDAAEQAGLAWIQTARSPYFLYLHWIEAHQYFGWTSDDKRDRADSLPRPVERAVRATAPGDTCEEPRAERCISFLAYAHSIFEQRVAVARTLDALEARGLLDETVVVLYSDHGEEFEDHRAQAEARRVDPRRTYGIGHGHSLYQELLRVPLLVWYPRVDGRPIAAPVSLVDLTPSLLDWLDIDVPIGMLDGRPLSRAIHGASVEPRPRFASGIAYGPEQVSVELGGLKRVWHAGSSEREIFDLTSDAHEENPHASGIDTEPFDELIDEKRRALRHVAGTPAAVTLTDRGDRAPEEPRLRRRYEVAHSALEQARAGLLSGRASRLEFRHFHAPYVAVRPLMVAD